MAERIEALIARSNAWLDEHRRAGRKVEAAACAIRIRALQDALHIVKGEP